MGETNDNNSGPLYNVREMTSVCVDMQRLDLEIPKDLLEDEEAMKEWIWEKSKSKLFGAIKVKKSGEPTELERAQVSLKLLDNIAEVQRQYLQMEEPKIVFGTLLENLLELMDSEYGFIGEVKHQEDGTPYLQTHAITNIAWDAGTRAFYDDNIESGLKFVNLKSLFGHVIVEAEPLIANEPQNHPFSCGIPPGHPPLNHFLGIPFFEARGTKMNGMVGIANKPGGYSKADIEFLEPFTVTCSNLIQAYNAIRENKYLINTLEEKVAGRTRELQLANESLELANRRVVRASQAQLQHFACMSHEIRTPLNCIIGLSSLLQETQLNPYQEDSLGMIVTSGELLLTVVDDVLDYSKLESGNVDIDIKRSNLQAALDAVVHSIAQKSRENNLKVKTYYDNTIPEFIDTDSRRLQQILYNLLGNAIKFSKDEGFVELTVQIIDTAAVPNIEMDISEGEQIFEPDVTPEEDAVSTSESTEAGEEGAQPSVVDNAEASSSECPFTGQSSSSPTPSAESDGADRCPFLPVNERTESQSVKQAKEARKKRKPAPSSFTSHDIKDSQRSFDNGFLSAILQVNEDKPPARRTLRFIVKDYGTGIYEKDFERIFKPFKQANSYTEQLYGGTGLGLAITSKLAKGLGGTIFVDSVKGEWSEFTVDFPFYNELAETAKMAKKLERLTVISVNKYASPNTVERNVFDKNSIHCLKFADMGAMAETMSKKDAIVPGRFYICLIQEHLYKAEAYKRFSRIAKTTLLTYGPNYSVKETCCHYRSLLQVLPSVLIESFYKQMEAALTAVPGANLEDAADSQPIAYDQIKVLIAEDNTINQKVLTRMLNRLGVTKVDVVDNGQKAVDREAEKGDYDIVYMDMQMPVMDGIDATKFIVERRGDNPRPKVVFVTANVSTAFESEAQNAGGDGFISKPFSIQGIKNSFKLVRS
jgi:signal transduction histidine kinase/CheY-like chemotaxis protein